MQVTSKQQMKRMLVAGEFGNVIRSWATYDEMVKAGYRGKVYVRSNLWSAINARMNEVPLEEVMATLQRHNIAPDTCRYFENPPNDQRVIQGEICSNPTLSLTYSLIQKPLSDALKEKSRHVDGIAARTILKQYLQPNSIDWLEYLLDTYEGAAIEFTEFKSPQGMLNDYLVIWEVRHF